MPTSGLWIGLVAAKTFPATVDQALQQPGEEHTWASGKQHFATSDRYAAMGLSIYPQYVVDGPAKGG
ncbi:MAG: hypothetical protein CYG59_02235 [Chloroflexi bacterium]|nr:MAG: hypothetical protein CYG59_02235 [Chloroflexota bacterium]